MPSDEHKSGYLFSKSLVCAVVTIALVAATCDILGQLQVPLNEQEEESSDGTPILVEREEEAHMHAHESESANSETPTLVERGGESPVHAHEDENNLDSYSIVSEEVNSVSSTIRDDSFDFHRRVGMDVYYFMTVTQEEATTGISTTITSPLNHTLKIPVRVSDVFDDTKLLLLGYGALNRATGEYGSMIIRFLVLPPPRTSRSNLTSDSDSTTKKEKIA